MTHMTEIPTLDFSTAIKQAANRILQFQGRARRSEYWWTMLVVYAAGFVLTPIVGFILNLLTIPLTFRRLHDTGRSGWWWGAGLILEAALFPFLFYDILKFSFNAESMIMDNDFEPLFLLIGKYSIWLLLILIYRVLTFVFMCLDSDPHTNQYGPSPKYTEAKDRF